MKAGAVALAARWLGTSEAAAPVSFSREIAPLFDRSCVACHQPAKLKGKLDLTTFAALGVGGKHGPIFVASDASKSFVVTQVKGPNPEMPPEGKPLSTSEVALLERWITEGASDDTASMTRVPAPPARYFALPVVSSLAWSPDGTTLAATGNGEVILFAATNYTRRARLHGLAAQVESVQFAPDGQTLAVAGGTPSRFGEVQFWDPTTGALKRSSRAGGDSVFGLNWSPDGTRVAVGGADKSVRVFVAEDGRELFHFEQHSDWVFGACFTLDGTRVVSAGRDRTMKLLDAADGRLLDEICRPNEPLLGLQRHPTENLVAALGGEARVRVFRAQPKPDNNDPNADPNFVREYEHFEGGMTAAAYSPDGQWFATAGAPAGEVRVYEAATTHRKARLRNHEGLVFALVFSPDERQLATAGFEGVVRIFSWETERLTAIFSVVSPDPDFGHAEAGPGGRPYSKLLSR